jgi:hypothetical protein
LSKNPNRHHILEEAAEWTSSPNARILRTNPILVPTIDYDIHQEIHKNCPPVALLGRYALEQVLNTFSPTNDTLRSLDRLLACIDRASCHKKAHPLERELAQLSIKCIEEQIPYLKEGIIV